VIANFNYPSKTRMEYLTYPPRFLRVGTTSSFEEIDHNSPRYQKLFIYIERSSHKFVRCISDYRCVYFVSYLFDGYEESDAKEKCVILIKDLWNVTHEIYMSLITT
jgi:hypothetical protein